MCMEEVNNVNSAIWMRSLPWEPLATSSAGLRSLTGSLSGWGSGCQVATVYHTHPTRFNDRGILEGPCRLVKNEWALKPE